MKRCRCGYPFTSPLEDWACLTCGRDCCPACAYSPDNVVYCAECAREAFNLAAHPNSASGYGVVYSFPG